MTETCIASKDKLPDNPIYCFSTIYSHQFPVTVTNSVDLVKP